MVSRSRDQSVLGNPLHAEEVLRSRHNGTVSRPEIEEPELGMHGFTVIGINQKIPVRRPTWYPRAFVHNFLRRTTLHANDLHSNKRCLASTITGVKSPYHS
jgi:hypothetical protein